MYVRNRTKNKNKKRINRVVSNKSKTSRQKRNSKTSTKTVKKTTDTNFLDFFKNKKLLISLGIFLILFAVLLFISFYSYLSTWKEDNLIFDKGFNIIFSSKYSVNNITGKLGGWLAFVFMYKWFGVASFLFIPWFFITGLKLIGVKLKRYVFLTTILFSLILYFSLFFSGLFTTVGYGVLRGCIGDELIKMITLWIGKPGLILFLVFTGLILLSVIIPKLFYNAIEKVKNIKLSSKTAGTEENSSETSNSLIENEDEEENIEDKENEDAIDEEEFKIIDISNNENEDTADRKEEDDELEDEEEDEEDEEDTDSIEQEEIPFEIVNPLEATNEVAEEDCIDDEEDENIPITSEPYDPKKDLSDFILPMHDLLAEHGSASIIIDKEELEANKKRIETTLQNYGIKIEKIVATIGPSVTLYEIVPAPGIRISKIKNLEDDIALSLAALGIRIIAPIPGKGTIGIEVPNKKPEIVSLKSVVSNNLFLNTNYELPIALGKTITNDVYIADLAKMPHLLMAGATGQGKSVGLNAIIASLLFKKHPAELKFVMVDPKKVELPLFSKIERHYLAKLPDAEEAIITDTSQVVKTLKGLVLEMEQRYDLLKNAHVRNIKEYNAKFISRRLNPNNGHKFLPYIVLIVDEFADLIMTAGKEVEAPIARLAQLARAVGIHLVIATQRPSVNIITGVIKANFPARLAFRVSAKVDSRTILDTSGADQLIGRGDMLLSTGSSIVRIQCAFIDTPELEEITEFIGSQRAYPTAFILPEVIADEDESNRGDFDSENKDPMFAEAARIIVTKQRGSTSLLQRNLNLGYNRAGRIIDQLEATGIVGPFEGSKAREVLIKDIESLEQLLRELLN